jgi:hypothetical protein
VRSASRPARPPGNIALTLGLRGDQRGGAELRAVQTTLIMLLVAMGEAYAQSAPPGSAADVAQDDRGIAPWPWIIIGVVILAAVVWAYQRRRGGRSL